MIKNYDWRIGGSQDPQDPPLATPTARGLSDFAQFWYVGSLLVPEDPAIVEIHLP